MIDAAFALIDAALAAPNEKERAAKPHDFALGLVSVGARGHAVAHERSAASSPRLLLSALTDAAACATPPESQTARHTRLLTAELQDTSAIEGNNNNNNNDNAMMATTMMMMTWPRSADALLLVPPVPPLSRVELLVGTAAHADAPVWHELTSLVAPAHGDADNSTSAQRAPAALADFQRGTSQNVPFLPGGFTPPSSAVTHAGVLASTKAALASDSLLRLRSDELLAVAPGLRRGLTPGDSAGGDDAEDADAVLRLPPLPVPDVASLLAASAQALDREDQTEAPPATSSEAATSTATATTTAAAAAAATTTTTTTATSNAALDSALDSLVGTAEAARLRARAHEAKRTEFKWATMDATDTSKFREAVPSPAIAYPFELDHFQKASIMHIEKGESILVAAHTSAGKTVVAEYAIALAARRLTRALYTSPIKALSNQKFRDFRATFGDDNVGIITGDISLNPEASCLILTTEILRSMLYKGADLIRDVEWCVFDEIHYLNDAERGVVWEEVIIMLPEHVNLVFLSATIPNALEFSEWVGRTKQRHVYVVATNKRPVPLEHHLYTSNNELFLVRDRHGEFLAKNVAAAAKSHKDRIDADKLKAKAKGQAPGFVDHGAKPQWSQLLRHLERSELMPCVVFHFSKKKCEEVADALGANTLLLAADERRQVSAFVAHCVARLKPCDRKLQQVRRLSQLLDRGIAVHHGGLLPMMKEMVEMLFARGLVKVLFATETFAMGVNMPARCVVFGQTRKHDGREHRNLQPGEYTQMAGRAGRRGLDETGTVLICVWGEPPATDELRAMLCGTSMTLTSQFRLTYNMILNLLRVADFNVQEMMRRSFGEFHTQRLLPAQEEELARAELELTQLDAALAQQGVSDDAAQFFELAAQLATLERQVMRTALDASPRLKTLLTPGRLVVCRQQPSRYGMWVRRAGVVVAPRDGDSVRVLFITFDVDGRESAAVTRVDVSDLIDVSSQTLALKSPVSIAAGDRKAVAEALQQLSVALAAFSSGEPPLLDLVQDAKVLDIDHADRVARVRALRSRLAQMPCAKSAQLPAQFAALRQRDEVQQRVRDLKHRLSAHALALMPDFERRVQVLQVLNYVDAQRTVQLKGRVAREINTSDELILTELLFSNIFAEMSPAEAVALLSCFVFQEKVEATPRLTSTLSSICERVRGVIDSLLQLQQDCGVALDPDEYVAQFNTGLIEVVYEWASATPFAEICQLTDVLEGSIVRCIVRTHETCKELRNAARVLGNQALEEQMDKAQLLIVRDIVFSSSLYYEK